MSIAGHFEIRPSMIFLALLIAVHLLTIVSISQTALEPWARVAIIVVIVLSLLYQVYLHLGKTSWRSVTLDGRHIIITTQDGKVIAGELNQQTVVIPFCVVLCIKPDSQYFTVCQVIFKDGMQIDAFRNLRVRLRFS
jgi:hypothetical protein